MTLMQKIYQEQWLIGMNGEREPKESVLLACLINDDNIMAIQFKWNKYEISQVVNDTHLYTWAIGLMSRVFANGPGDCGSIPG